METITFKSELECLLNRYSKENDSNTPDFLLSEYLIDCLEVYNKALKNRDKWFNIDVWERNQTDKIK